MEIRPFEVMDDLAKGDPPTAVWRQQVERAGISSVGLGAVVEETSHALTIEDVLEYFDEAASKGAFMAVGPSPLANRPGDAVRDMLLQAQAYLKAGNVVAAKAQLELAYRRCDRQPVPSTFVFGEAAEYLAEMVQELIDELDE